MLLGAVAVVLLRLEVREVLHISVELEMGS